MKNKRILIGCIVVIMAGVLSGFVPATPQLFILNENTGKIILEHNIQPGDTFDMNYMHSVNRSRVTDHFVITDDYQIKVESTDFSAYGAGIPEPEGGQTITLYDDHVTIDGLDRLVDPYRFFVGTIADHNITICDDAPIHFTDLVEPKSSLVVDIRRAGFWQVLF